MESIKSIIHKIELLYGTKLRRGSEINGTQFISTGIPSLDNLIKYPIGGIIEIVGPSSIKSSIAYRAIYSFQQIPEKTILYVSTNNSYHPEWAAKLGVDNNNIWFMYDNDIEKVFGVIKTMVHSSITSLIVIDEIPGLVVNKQIEVDEHAKIRAEKLNYHLQGVAPYLKIHETTLLLINGLRNDKVSIGGQAIYRLSDIRIEVIPQSITAESITAKIDIKKNNFGPISSGYITLKFNEGFCNE